MRFVALSVSLVLTVCSGGADAVAGCPFAPSPAALVAQPLPSDIPSSGRPVKVVPPKYPDCALARSVAGFVDLVFTIEPDGSVGDLQVLQEVPVGFGFLKSALDVFPRWKFQPKMIDGKADVTRVTYRMSWKPN